MLEDVRESHIGRTHLDGAVVIGPYGFGADWQCNQCKNRVMLCCYGIECPSCLSVVKRHNCEEAIANAKAIIEREEQRLKRRHK